MNRYLNAGAIAAVALLVTALPADACDICGSGDVSDAGVRARARTQIADLNAGYGSSPPDCNDEHHLAPEDDNDIVEYEGHLRYVPDFANDPTRAAPRRDRSVEWYEQICVIPERPGRPGESSVASTTSPRDPGPGGGRRRTGEIPTQTINSNPTTAAMVAIPTWFWVDGVPADGVSATVSIPGVSVTATASPGGVQYDFGDGTSLQCEGSGTPYAPGATSDCIHDFETAGNYQITATILWTGTYSINGGAPSVDAAIVARVLRLTERARPQHRFGR